MQQAGGLLADTACLLGGSGLAGRLAVQQHRGAQARGGEAGLQGSCLQARRQVERAKL